MTDVIEICTRINQWCDPYFTSRLGYQEFALRDSREPCGLTVIMDNQTAMSVVNMTWLAHDLFC